MVYYSRIKKDFKAIAEQNNDIINGQKVDFKGKYRFCVSDIAAARNKKEYLILIFFCAVATILPFIAFINDPNENNKILIWSLILFFGSLGILMIFLRKKFKDTLIKSYIHYNNGYFEYCNGIGKSYRFTINDIERIDFATQGRTTKWILYISIKDARFQLDILKYNNPKLIFALLLGADKRTHVLF